MPVIDKTGPLKAKGDMITFNTIEQLMGTGVTSENVLKGNEEKLGIGSFTVTADIVRHAVAVSKKSTFQANFNEIKQAGSLLKDWMARKLDADVFTTITGSDDAAIPKHGKWVLFSYIYAYLAGRKFFSHKLQEMLPVGKYA